MKIYIEVVCKHTADGKVLPLEVVWGNGKHYKIDRVIDARKCASLKGGGVGVRYACQIMGQKKFLFLDGYRWYVESGD